MKSSLTVLLALTLAASAQQNNLPTVEPQSHDQAFFKAANKTQAISQLKNLHVIAFMEAQKNNGNFPKDLETLIKLASSQGANLGKTINWPKKDSPLTYVKGLKTSSPAETILLHSAPDDKGNRIVAYLNGACTTITAEEFKKKTTPPKK